MVQTAWVCLVLAIASLMFGRNSKELVLIPIERMIGKMHRIRDNPLVAMKLGDEEYRKQEIERKRAQDLDEDSKSIFSRLKWFRANRKKKKKKIQEPMETVILESTLIKLGGLLAVGFGVAGAEIIGQNMSGTDSSGVNAMVAGQKVEAIFGFCNIGNFSDATEILKDRVMIFVNQIAEIVHSIVDMYGGNANKNIGDAFLLVWKVATVPSDLTEELEDVVVTKDHFQRRMRMCDMSVVAFCSAICAINKSSILADYREHPGFLARITNYRVTMGFGLHLGYAIEGAIGSEFKIDASYLSPNVNTASRLEAATKQFKINLLMSHFLIDQCSTQFRDCCRQIDRVYVKGSKKPVGLYTCDLATGIIRVVDMMSGIDPKSFTVRRKYEVRQIREIKKSKKWADDYEAHRELLEDPEVIEMRRSFSKEFFQRFSMGFRNYINGVWPVAKQMLSITRNMIISRNAGSKYAHVMIDNPSDTLLQYMSAYDFEAPKDWKGVRALTSK